MTAPARSSLKVGGTNMRVYVEMDGVDRTAAIFKKARRDIGIDLRDAVAKAGEEEVLPVARTHAGTLKVAGRSVAGTLVVRKGRGNTAYITSTMRGKLGRAVGLQEFGGTVKTVLLPKRKRALVVNGHPVARVDTPRHYKGRHFMTNAVDERRDSIAGAIMRELLRTFDPIAHTP
jgi:hypothetical protein